MNLFVNHPCWMVFLCPKICQTILLHLTTGEAGIEGKNYAEAASIRKQEAMKACQVLHAKPIFAGQVDGNTVIDNTWLKKIETLIYNEEPDVVLTHWPLDSHPDHQVASLLTIQAWMKSNKKFSLYFFGSLCR